MPKLLRCTLLICLGFASGIAASAQLVKPLAIKIQGTNEYSVAELEAVTGLKPGQVYSSDELNRRSQQLLTTGVFEKVGYKFDGVDLVLLLTVSSQHYPIELENLPLDPGADLTEALKKKVPLFHGLAPTEGGTLNALCKALQEMLTDQGIQANVVAETSGNAAAHVIKAMKFSIASPAVKIGQLQIEGLSDAMSPVVTAFAAHAGGPYQTGVTELNLQQRLESVYQSAGYAAVEVTVHHKAGATSNADGIRVPFAVVIKEGKVYKLGAIDLATGIPVDRAVLEKAVGPRERYTPDSRYLSAMIAQLATQLKSKGYLDSTVSSELHPDDAAGVANYTIHANVGPVYRLAFVKFADVSDDLRTLLMRNWQMLPGDPFDESYVGTFILKAQGSDSGLRTALAGMKANYDVRADAETHEVNLVVRLVKQ